MGLTEEERATARAMGVSEFQIRMAASDMEQAERDYADDEEERRLAYVDALRTCNRCPLTTEELLECSLEQLEELYETYGR